MNRRRTTRRRLLRLGAGELVAAAVFVLVVANSVTRFPAAALPVWSAVTPLVVVLVQAGVYWLVRGRTATLPAQMVTTYRVFRALDVGLLALGLMGVVWWWPSEPLPAGLAVAVWLFGVVEYLNYFVVRLAYPPARWLPEVGRWRTPQLLKDLNR